MSAIREGTRQSMAWLHGWAGLLLGHILFIMCLTGTLAVFKPEISRWMRPEATAQATPAAAIIAATDWLSRNTTGSNGWYLTAPDERSNVVEAGYDSKDAPYRMQALDPVSGAPVGRDTIGGEFFYRMHFELKLPYPWGRLLASFAAMAMLVALVTGVIAHKRIFKDIFTFRPAKGQRSWLDGHNALGVLALPFHIMITFTGILTLASLNLPWAMTSAYGEDLATLYTDLVPGAVSRVATGEKAPLAPMAPMLAQAQRHFSGAEIARVYVFNPGDSAAVVTVYPSERGVIGYLPGEISFDGATGKVLKAWTENRTGIQTYQTIYGLHMAHFAPSVTRWLYFLGGGMLTMAIGTGMILWIVKRRERTPLSWGNRVLERINAGIIGGVPVAAVAYLIANRLLPLDMAARPGAEVAASMWTGAVCLLIGLVLRPALSWPVLLGLLVLGCASAAAMGPVWSTDPVIMAVNLALLVLAALIVPTLVRQVHRLRSPAPAPKRRRAAA